MKKERETLRLRQETQLAPIKAKLTLLKYMRLSTNDNKTSSHDHYKYINQTQPLGTDSTALRAINDTAAVHQSSHNQTLILSEAGSRTYPGTSDASDPRCWLQSLLPGCH